MAQKQNRIEPEEWFERIVGMEEESFKAADRSKIIVPAQSGSGDLEIINQQTQKRFLAGTFSTISLGDLENTFKEQIESKVGPNDEPALFEVICRKDRPSVKYVDVAFQQAQPENKDAVFQAASNFNGMECISEYSTPDDEDFVTNYIQDQTQGPAASISAGPAAITRVYAAFYDPQKPYSEWAQTPNKQVNFLGDEELKKHFPMENGYVVCKGDEPPFPSPGTAEYEALLSKASIGYHQNCQVTTAESKSYQYVTVEDDSQKVDQVFTAAMNIGQGASGKLNKTQKGGRERARFCLDVAYRGTYLSAIKAGRSQIFLTLIGGGVFGNDRDQIIEALVEAHARYAKSAAASGIRKVSLVMYGIEPVDEKLCGRLNAKGIPYRYTQWSRSPNKEFVSNVIAQSAATSTNVQRSNTGTTFEPSPDALKQRQEREEETKQKETPVENKNVENKNVEDKNAKTIGAGGPPENENDFRIVQVQCPKCRVTLDMTFGLKGYPEGVARCAKCSGSFKYKITLLGTD